MDWLVPRTASKILPYEGSFTFITNLKSCFEVLNNLVNNYPSKPLPFIKRKHTLLNRILHCGQIWLMNTATSSKIKSDVSKAEKKLVKVTISSKNQT